MPTSKTSQKSSILKVGNIIFSAQWYMYTYSIAIVVHEKKMFEKHWYYLKRPDVSSCLWSSMRWGAEVFCIVFKFEFCVIFGWFWSCSYAWKLIGFILFWCTTHSWQYCTVLLAIARRLLSSKVMSVILKSELIFA
jgi:hypothetical protein